MKLIYAANARIPSQKAHPYQIVQMCEALAGAGVEVRLLYANRRNPPELRTDNIWGFYGVERVFSAERLFCLDVHPLADRLPGRLSLMWSRLSAILVLLTYNLALLVRLAREREAIIYSRDPISLRLVARMWPRRAQRLFFEAHTYPATQMGVRLRKLLAKRIGGFVVVTRHLHGRYEALGVPPERLIAAHDAIRPARFEIEGDRAHWRKRFGWPVDAFIVGYMGRFHTLGVDKGLDTLIEAFAELVGDQSVRPVRLALVGGPAERVAELREYLAGRGISPDVVLYPGQVPPADVPKYLRAFSVCTMPFPWTDHFAYYASPMKLFEYMASDSPLVASDLPSTAEIVRDGENGLLVPPTDVPALVGALRRLRDDPEFGKQLAEKAGRDVLDHTWDARARRIVELIRA